MKILIVSDTHGHSENLEKVLEQTGPLDHFIHLGDVEGQGRLYRGYCRLPRTYGVRK